MILFVLIYLVIILKGCKFNKCKNVGLDISDSNILKGLWAIIITMVHIPSVYQNSIQDMIGSFAYVGVIFFSLTSYFGLMNGIEKNNNYLKHFWKKIN